MNKHLRTILCAASFAIIVSQAESNPELAVEAGIRVDRQKPREGLEIGEGLEQPALGRPLEIKRKVVRLRTATRCGAGLLPTAAIYIPARS